MITPPGRLQNLFARKSELCSLGAIAKPTTKDMFSLACDMVEHESMLVLAAYAQRNGLSIMDAFVQVINGAADVK